MKPRCAAIVCSAAAGSARSHACSSSQMNTMYSAINATSLAVESSRHDPLSGGHDLGDLNVHRADQPRAPGRQARGVVEIVGFDDNIAAEHRGARIATVRRGQGPGGPDPVTPVGDRRPELAEPGAPRLLLVGGRGPARLAAECDDVLAHGHAPFGSGRLSPARTPYVARHSPGSTPEYRERTSGPAGRASALRDRAHDHDHLVRLKRGL